MSLERYINRDLVPAATFELAEIIALSAGVIAVYQAAGATSPAPVLALQEQARKVFASRIRDELLAKREEVLRRIDGLQTPAERRKAAEAELKALEQQLGE